MSQACFSINSYIKFHEGYLKNIRLLKQKLRSKISVIENSIESKKFVIKEIMDKDNNENINNLSDLIMEPISPMFKMEENYNVIIKFCIIFKIKHINFLMKFSINVCYNINNISRILMILIVLKKN